MSNGLDDVVAAETRLSDVDGSVGRLTIAGRSLQGLAGSRAEDVAALLLSGMFEGVADTTELLPLLGKARAEVFAEVAFADARLLALPPVDAMRALLARLPEGDDLPTALRLIAAPAVFLPAILRLQQGLTPIAPDPEFSQAADILRMLHGAVPSPEQIAALDAYLVTVSDHGLNASTFAARIVASTRAGLTSSVLAAIGALKGPLHGGAPEPVLDMLDAVGKPERAAAWLTASLDRGERLMGFGHRIYRVRDPRADALRNALQPLITTGQVDPDRIALADAVETAALALLRERKPGRVLLTNVEFNTALLLEALGFPRRAFTGVFTMGRVVGWIAHAREQTLDGRLIRPQSRYVGPQPKAA